MTDSCTFQFQRFSLAHGRAGMKVGTDGILLGAWATIDDCRNILDVGTGCGLIALMLAQRTEHLASKITAIDIDLLATQQAAENFNNSPWPDRLHTCFGDFEEFAEAKQPEGKSFDLIVCNPPFFESGMPSPDAQRAVSRHQSRLTIPALVQSAIGLLSPRGRLAIILPWEQDEVACENALAVGFSLHRKTSVCPLPQRPPKRVLIEFGVSEQRPVLDKLTIERVHHEYTSKFRELTKDFYLRFTGSFDNKAWK